MAAQGDQRAGLTGGVDMLLLEPQKRQPGVGVVYQSLTNMTFKGHSLLKVVVKVSIFLL